MPFSDELSSAIRRITDWMAPVQRLAGAVLDRARPQEDLRSRERAAAPIISPASYLEIRETETDSEWGWTMERLQGAMQGQALGELRSGEALRLAMMRDPIIAECIETRAETLVQLDQWWVRPEELPEWAFKLWVEHWPRCLVPSEHQEIAESRLMLGVDPTNPTWHPDRTGRLWMPTLHLKEASNLTYRSSPDERRYYFQGIDKEWPVYNDGERFLLWQRKSRRPHLSGLVLPLGVAWMTEAEALRQWPSRNRSHGKPQRLLEVPASERESEDVRRLVAQAQALLAGGVMIMPKYGGDRPNFDFKLLQDTGDVSATFENLIRLCWAYKKLLIMGATENTEGSSASDAKARTHDKVFLRKVGRDAKSDLESKRTLAGAWARMNRFPPRAAPIPCVDADIPEDENDVASRQEKRARAGGQVGSLISTLRKEKVPHEPDYLLEQVGLHLTRKQGSTAARGTS